MFFSISIASTNSFRQEKDVLACFERYIREHWQSLSRRPVGAECTIPLAYVPICRSAIEAHPFRDCPELSVGLDDRGR